MCLFYFGGFPRNPVYRPIACQLSGGERVKFLGNTGTAHFDPCRGRIPPDTLNVYGLCVSIKMHVSYYKCSPLPRTTIIITSAVEFKSNHYQNGQ